MQGNVLGQIPLNCWPSRMRRVDCGWCWVPIALVLIPCLVPGATLALLGAWLLPSILPL